MDPCAAEQALANALTMLQLQVAQIIQGIGAMQAQLMMLQAASLNAKGTVDQQLMIANQALQQCRAQNP